MIGCNKKVNGHCHCLFIEYNEINCFKGNKHNKHIFCDYINAVKINFDEESDEQHYNLFRI